MNQDRRSGSETRKRGRIIPVRVSDQEGATIDKLTGATGLSAAALLRNTLLKIPLPRARFPRLNEGLFAKALARLAALTAELNKHGSNLNQLTHYINAERPVSTLENQLVACLHREEELQREVLELRALFMQAMDAERLPRDEKA